MFTKFSLHNFAIGALALLTFILAACSPLALMPATGAHPTQPPTAPTPASAFLGLKPADILIQLAYEPGFMLPEYRFDFGRVPYFTLLADGRAIFVDENNDSRIMLVQLSQAEAGALLQKVRDLGFARLESYTDMCGTAPDGSETCIADMSTTLLRVHQEDGRLREIKNYANFSNDPAAYLAIYNLLNDYTNPAAVDYVPAGATLFVRILPSPAEASPADWPLNPAYVQRAQAAPDQFTAVTLNPDQMNAWMQAVGSNSASVTLQLDGQPVLARVVPWLPGQDFTAAIAAQFPQQ